MPQHAVDGVQIKKAAFLIWQPADRLTNGARSLGFASHPYGSVTLRLYTGMCVTLRGLPFTKET